jgi:hypothetical protein
MSCVPRMSFPNSTRRVAVDLGWCFDVFSPHLLRDHRQQPSSQKGEWFSPMKRSKVLELLRQVQVIRHVSESGGHCFCSVGKSVVSFASFACDSAVQSVLFYDSNIHQSHTVVLDLCLPLILLKSLRRKPIVVSWVTSMLGPVVFSPLVRPEPPGVSISPVFSLPVAVSPTVSETARQCAVEFREHSRTLAILLCPDNQDFSVISNRLQVPAAWCCVQAELEVSVLFPIMVPKT